MKKRITQIGALFFVGLFTWQCKQNSAVQTINVKGSELTICNIDLTGLSFDTIN